MPSQPCKGAEHRPLAPALKPPTGALAGYARAGHAGGDQGRQGRALAPAAFAAAPPYWPSISHLLHRSLGTHDAPCAKSRLRKASRPRRNGRIHDDHCSTCLECVCLCWCWQGVPQQRVVSREGNNSYVERSLIVITVVRYTALPVRHVNRDEDPRSSYGHVGVPHIQLYTSYDSPLYL